MLNENAIEEVLSYDGIFSILEEKYGFTKESGGQI